MKLLGVIKTEYLRIATKEHHVISAFGDELFSIRVTEIIPLFLSSIIIIIN